MSRNFIEMYSDFFHVGVRIDIFINLHFLFCKFFFQGTSFPQIQDLVIIHKLYGHKVGWSCVWLWVCKFDNNSCLLFCSIDFLKVLVFNGQFIDLFLRNTILRCRFNRKSVIFVEFRICTNAQCGLTYKELCIEISSYIDHICCKFQVLFYFSLLGPTFKIEMGESTFLKEYEAIYMLIELDRISSISTHILKGKCGVSLVSFDLNIESIFVALAHLFVLENILCIFHVFNRMHLQWFL